MSSGETKRVANNIFFQEVKELLDQGKEVLFVINGTSMLPFLAHGDKVQVTPVTKGSFTFGKIILAKSNFGYVLHRLVWKNKTHIWLAGDNNLVQLEKVEKSNVLGYVKFALVDESKKDVHSTWNIFLAGIWFFLRPVRLVIHKIKEIFK